MEIVKLKMKRSYKFMLLFISFFITFLIVLGFVYKKDGNKFNDEFDIEVKNNLSVNYVDGRKVNVTNEKDIRLSVTNDSLDSNYFVISFSDIKGSGQYKVMQDENEVVSGKITSSQETIIDNFIIEGESTKNYVIHFTSDDNELSLMIDVLNQTGLRVTFADIILKNNEVKNNPITKLVDEAALENEGLIKSVDNLGTSYYFRGNVLNNYVLFENMLWRIVRINGDNSVRIVLNSTLEDKSNFYSNIDEEKNYETSKVNTFLNSWFNSKITNKDYISNSEYCNDFDQNVDSNYTRLFVDKIPTLNCLGNTINSKVGLLTLDEVILAGASNKSNNNKYYLYNEDNKTDWYTLNYAKGKKNTVNVYVIGEEGNIKDDVAGNLYRGIRPVVNISKNATVTGEGTIQNPYEIKN